MIQEKILEAGIRPRDFSQGNQKLICPQCSSQRKNKSDPCLSLTIDEAGATWHCHHCDWSGGFKSGEKSWKPVQRRVRIEQRPEALPAHIVSWFADRGISEDSLSYADIGWSERRQSIVFPYRWPGQSEMCNAKFRKLPKEFRQITGGDKIFWNLDRVSPERSKDIYIVEGEMDALSLIEAGVFNVISVPDGAPKEVKETDADSVKFSYVADCDEYLEGFDRIIIAADADGPGQALSEELARRYGKDRCWKIVWPDKIKDANDFLIEYGKSSLAEICSQPEPFPVNGIFSAKDYYEDVVSLYDGGRARGISTGLDSVDEFYTVAPGQLTIVTGIPNHGKSEFVDQMTTNLALSQGWGFGICSFENDPPNHISKLAEKMMHMPFWDGPSRRMDKSQLFKAVAKINQHFWFIRADEDDTPTIDWILEKARTLVKRNGIRGLVIDPYNEIEHKRPDGVTETEYVSWMLSKIKRFAQSHDCHVWFIAHPAKMKTEGGKTPVPTLYDIAGSANFVNKADCGIVVQRGQVDGTTEIYIRKVRFKWVGQQGKALLSYDKVCGVYSDPSGEWSA